MGRPGSVGAVEWAPRPQEVAVLRFGPGVWQVSSAAGGREAGRRAESQGSAVGKGLVPAGLAPCHASDSVLGQLGTGLSLQTRDGRVSFEWNVLFP